MHSRELLAILQAAEAAREDKDAILQDHAEQARNLQCATLNHVEPHGSLPIKTYGHFVTYWPCDPFGFMHPEIIEESDPDMSYEQDAPQLAALDDHISLSGDIVPAEQGDDNASENEGDDGGMSYDDLPSDEVELDSLSPSSDTSETLIEKRLTLIGERGGGVSPS
ncbi:hypothetical protein N7471_008840 [Penicillium samsonianum]|uniref:uncharacterized protein n=1 Tax=Penicillium samsonianum TaxID=1882272 RepID=UPI002548B5C2|nr:uncharacterized protein N7471_008840 [Penicillium samsonianum]KAJ6133625.1 hypothetical protein N7471_008840 [Penicillium samsonianum]